ncbi:MAG TPA: cytochrome c oxidase subunit II [Ktedonobacterales bacterium]|jgi:cytochrome c oxidase subunit 2
MKFATARPRVAVFALLALIALVALAGCGEQNGANFLNPSGPQAEQEANLFWFILAVATVIFVVVTAALIYSVIRFRARPDGPAARQISGNSTLEIAWTIVPSLVLLGVLILTINTLFVGLAKPEQATFTVQAIGHQWWWEFRYPDQKIVTADEMVIPVGKVVDIELISNNVIHSFWVPELAGKTDVIPGRTNTMWLKANNTGTFRGECTEYCGQQHANMNFQVVVEDDAGFQNWVTQQQQGPSEASQAMPGQKIFAQRCFTCHLINGQTESVSQIGPNLTHFGSRNLIAGGVLTNTPENLKAWIHDTQQFKPGNDMPAFTAIPDDQLDELVAYLESLQ